MDKYMRVVIVGATSAIARHCARIWLERHPVDLTLVGRDAERLEQTAQDLRVRGQQHVSVQVMQGDLLAPGSIGSLVEDIAEDGKVDLVLIAHGALPNQRDCQTQLEECHRALEINGISPVLFAEAFAAHMEQADHGTLAVISSVAGDRGRKSNYIYGAAKGLVTRYVQGLQHRFSGTGVRVVLIKPGPTDTPMTAGFKTAGARLAPVEEVARRIVDDIQAGKQLIYAPRKWALIMLAVRHLPAFIFNRTNL